MRPWRACVENNTPESACCHNTGSKNEGVCAALTPKSEQRTCCCSLLFVLIHVTVERDGCVAGEAAAALEARDHRSELVCSLCGSEELRVTVPDAPDASAFYVYATRDVSRSVLRPETGYICTFHAIVVHVFLKLPCFLLGMCTSSAVPAGYHFSGQSVMAKQTQQQKESLFPHYFM